MGETMRESFTIADILNAANKYYAERYLSTFFNGVTGALKFGDGDTLAQFIVHEISETYDQESSRGEQVAEALKVLERARRDIRKAIKGLRELPIV
jgi:hypothetical protein